MKDDDFYEAKQKAIANAEEAAGLFFGAGVLLPVLGVMILCVECVRGPGRQILLILTATTAIFFGVRWLVQKLWVEPELRRIEKRWPTSEEKKTPWRR